MPQEKDNSHGNKKKAETRKETRSDNTTEAVHSSCSSQTEDNGTVMSIEESLTVITTAIEDDDAGRWEPMEVDCSASSSENTEYSKLPVMLRKEFASLGTQTEPTRVPIQRRALRTRFITKDHAFQSVSSTNSAVPSSNKRGAENRDARPQDYKMNYFKPVVFLLLSAMSVIFISILLHENQQIRRHSTDFANAVVELKQRIYGHEEAVNDLCDFLTHDTPSMKVIALVGGTGVGKSYTVDIIRRNFSRHYAIRTYYRPIKNIWEINLPLLYPNLIVLENLREHDLNDVTHFLYTRRKEYKDRLMTILAVFNFDQMEDGCLQQGRDDFGDAFKIRNRILGIGLPENNLKIISYEPLSKDALKMCIADAIEKSKLVIRESQFDNILNILIRNKAGCKGAYRQVQLIREKKVH
ncbi:PREDICTED: uncharacterized protein LOC105458661 isoform X1 [Wasmannia auropunctata]|uniref:uncharacterized protein LOC105458661 isoform X1 n=1 Tax=Wasmannia auropunctata TaxID=64793 RepID=UPI0005EF3ED2|nr:PREDICTED: uncharacterized protein LOC105458661 isoform X1 [Wasmannia auropunctata]XP_011702438.1 PREDICTED: uncharacterized protein LOC105458661 isoform X1 [Wasmannia auropunctata]